MGSDEGLLCTKCLLQYSGAWRNNFFGLRKWVCPRCRHESTWPMTTTRMVVYWVIVALFTVFAINMFAQYGTPPMPGIIAILIIIAPGMNYEAKRKLRDAQARLRAQLAAMPPPG